jgi:Ca2+-binding RTX toxin-like protein
MRRVVLVLAAMALALLLASGVAWAVNKIGTDGPDTLRGTNRADNLLGEGGNDVLFALGGRDNLLGGPGKDWVLGGNERRAFGGNKNLKGESGNDGVNGGIGSDNALGGSGNDFVLGDNGSDRVVGEEGKDLVLGGAGSDRIVGEEGTDLLTEGPLDDSWKDILSGGDGHDIIFIDSVPARRDIVSCGSGIDWVAADRKDVVGNDCERVRVLRGSEAEVIEQEAAFFETIPPAVTEFCGAWVESFCGPFFEGLAPDPFPGG